MVLERGFREDLRARLAQHGADDPHLLDAGTVVEDVHVDPGEREMVESVDVDPRGVERGNGQRRPAQAGRRAQVAADPHSSLGVDAVPDDRGTSDVPVAHEVVHGPGPHAVDLVRRSGWTAVGHQLDPLGRSGIPDII